MVTKEPICNITLGKTGDACIMLPAMKAVADATGIPPVFMIAEEFAPVLDGVSYVQPWPVKLNWCREVGKARQMAEPRFKHVIVGKWWDDPNAKTPTWFQDSRHVTLTHQGRNLQIAAKEWDSYQASQWRYSGFTMEQMLEWPLVFDRRDENREADLRRRLFKTDLPKLIVNLYPGGSSPWRYGNTILQWLHGFEVINITNVVAHRIYDLLGLYDHAAGLITSDTATLHLASASEVPYIAFVNNGGSGSIPKGNCLLKVRYDHVLKSRPMIDNALKRMLRESLATGKK